MESMSASPACPNVNAMPEKVVEVPLQDWLDALQKIQVSRHDMNRLIMNYLVTEGFMEAADKFRAESGVPVSQISVDPYSLNDRIRIREAIQAGRIQDAIGLLNDLNPELLDNNKQLYFRLLQQQTLELIRERRVEEALEFAQAHLAEHGSEDALVLPDIECTLALLAFDAPEASPYGDLLRPSHRQKVASEVNAALLAADGCESSSHLDGVLKLLLWAQDQLDTSKAKYPSMTSLVKGTLKDPK